MNLLRKRNIKLIIEYDGTNYSGWQTQAHVPSIQSTVKSAIEKLTGEDIILIGAGRTDSGVHAQGQAANFHTQTRLSVDSISLAINAHLPKDIAVKSAEEVPLDFNARKNAKAREYMYVVSNNKFRTALYRHYSYHVPLKLDIPAMKEAADYFKGKHDFSGFTGGRKTENGVRNIMKLDIKRKDDFICITVRANSFLTHMIRYMVAALLEAGRDIMKPEDIKIYLEPTLKKWTHSRAPAQGLFLMKVEY